jgi:hypothetical protein
MSKVPGQDAYECDCGCGAVAQRVKHNRYLSAMPAHWIRVRVADTTGSQEWELGFATVNCMRARMDDLDPPWAEP